MKTAHPSQWLKATTALTSAFGLAMVIGGSARANPVGGQVVAGEATISAPDAKTVQIDQSSPKAIVHWQSFNIDAGETTRFVQPDASAWTLNRVTGDVAPSVILGTIEANGNIAIINPDGILFGQGARVDVGGLVATTNDIANDDFMAGRFHFTQPGNPSASIVNEGSISIADYGLAAFVAPGVRNSGVITARMGRVALAAGNTFTLDLYGDDLIRLQVGDEIAAEVIDVATGEPVADLVKNEGRISANGGTVALKAATARRAVNSVVNNTGVIEASSVGTRGGKIVLGGGTTGTKAAAAPKQRVKISGTLSAKNIPVPTPRPDDSGWGGRIEITGEVIEVAAATIDASGTNGGGTILIGGDYMGGRGEPATIAGHGIKLEDKPVPTASNTLIDPQSVVSADALVSGDGGKVVVWADQDTRFAGTISAQGGETGGDGGFVEVSGRERLNFAGTVDVGAAAGANGTLLLDPLGVTIGTTGTWVVTPAAIQAALATGNVVVTTSNGPGNGDITVAEQLFWTTPNSLTVSAHRHIAVNASILNTGGADINLRADKTGTGIGTVMFAPGTQISTAGIASVFYNPSVNPAGSGVNPTSYMNPTEDFSVHLNALINRAYMLVNTVYDLQNMRNNLIGHYALGRDIDASETVTWNGGAGFVPIGTQAQPFLGLLNGLHRTIDQLTINASGNEIRVGLFGNFGPFNIVNPEVSAHDLYLTDVDITATIQDDGARVGAFAGEVGQNGRVGNVHVTGNVRLVVVPGGIVNCCGRFVGGLSGVNSGMISESSFVGDVVTNDNWGSAGGLVGSNVSGTISESFAAGTVTGGRETGGLVGTTWATFGGLIENSYSRMSVIAFANINYFAAGGLIGHNTEMAVQNSYAVGTVEGPNTSPSYTNHRGGLIGVDNDGLDFSSDSYWDVDASGLAASPGGGDPLTTVQLKAGLPAGFDPNVWAIDPAINDGYPYLRWQTATEPPPIMLTALGTVPPVPPTPPAPPVDPSQALPKPGTVPPTLEPTPLLAVSVPPQSLFNPSLGVAGSTPPFHPSLVFSATPEHIEISRKYGVYAILSNNVYGNEQIPLPFRWERGEVDRNILTGFYAEEYILRDESGEVIEVVIAFRGTQDWKTLDGRLDWIAGNLLGIQERDAEQFASNIKQRYGDQTDIKITLTGHSLGGHLAKHASKTTGIPDVVAFNSSPRGEAGENILLIESARDPLDIIRINKPEDIKFDLVWGHGIYDIAQRMEELI